MLTVDGCGTPGRGPAWEREIYLDIAGPVLADQVDGLEHAALQSPGLDLGHVGIRGWSFGGFLAALAVLRRPDMFHAAVAGAPVTDQRLYDTHWRERHLGHPDDHPEAYDRCSLVLEAASLRRPLLLVHGLADDNVVPAHTLRLSAALLAAGRPHEVLPLPRATHLPADQAVAANLLLHELDFLRRALGLPRPAAELRRPRPGGGHWAGPAAGGPRYTPVPGVRDTARRAAGRADWRGEPGNPRETVMSSGSPRLSSRGWRTRWIGAGLVAARRGLGFGALTAAGAGLLLALAAPLLLAGLAFGQWLRRSGAPANAFTVVPGGAPHPAGAGEPQARQLLLVALVVLAGCVVWLLLLPGILLAMRQLASLTRRLAGEWCGVRIADPYRPVPAAVRGTYLRQLRWVLTDPATGRDVLWLAVNSLRGLDPGRPARRAGHGRPGRVHRAGHPPAGRDPPARFPGEHGLRADRDGRGADRPGAGLRPRDAGRVRDAGPVHARPGWPG